MRFAAIHSGPMLKWQAAAIRLLLDRPGTVLAQCRALSAPRTARSALAMLGFQSSGSMMDELEVNEPAAQTPEGDLDFCIAFDGRAAALAPPSRLGTWLFDVDGAERPPGVNAFCENRDVVEARLLQIDGQGAITCLRSGALGVNRFSLPSTVNALLEELAQWPAIALRDIEAGLLQSAPAAPPVPTREPSAWTIARAATGLGLRRASAVVEKRFFTYSWNIGVADATPAHIASSKVLPPVAWCKAGSKRFLADPFGAVIDGTPTIYCEEIDPATSRGVIIRLDLAGGEIVPAERVLDEFYHLSYPYVFQHENAWYAIPESCKNGEVALYRVERSGREWHKHSVLIAGLRAVDSTVFFHNGMFWLLCGVNDDGPSHKLYVYLASALTGPWRPHPLNPVKIDLRSARPAGAPFMLDGTLHRPAQDCTRKYGRRIAIVRMNAIDERRYDEETVAFIEPPRGMYGRGVHTMSAMGGSTLVDGLRRDFSLRAAAWRTLRTLRRLAGGRVKGETNTLQE